MKKQLVISFFCCLSFLPAHAQNYQTVSSKRTALFTDSNNSVVSLRIDSVKVDIDSVFYPMKIIGQVDYDCFSPYEPSWAGRKIIVRNDGSNVYFNYDNDSIVIKTEAQLNEKWIAYQLIDSITVIAEVASIVQTIILGQPDSVKTIKYQVYDSKGNIVGHRLNNLPVSISKNYGWVKAINFNFFPSLIGDYEQYFATYTLIGLTNPKLGIQNLTWFDVYDFQPGDVFHILDDDFYFCGGTIYGYRKNIKTVYTYIDRSDYSDSIVYRVARDQHYKKEYHDSTIVFHINDTIKSVIRPFPNFDKLPDEPFYVDDSTGIGRNSMYIGGWIIKGKPIREFSQANDSCWSRIIADGYVLSSFLKGLGGPYYNYSETCSGSKYQLVYYKKGLETWGSPFDFTDVKVFTKADKIMIYPNPVRSKIYIEITNFEQPVIFKLFTSGGIEILQQTIQSAKQEVDVMSLVNGIYFYKIITSDQVLRTGKITLIH